MSQVSFDNYTRSGDVAVIAICVVMIILLTTSYVSRTRSFRIFMSIIVQLVCAAMVNISYHTLLMAQNPIYHPLIYVQRILYHALLLDVLFLFTLYTTVVSGLEHRKARVVAVISSVLLIGIIKSSTSC